MNQHQTLIRPAAGSHLEAAARLAAEPKSSGANVRGPARPPRGNALAEEAHHEAIGAALAEVARIVGRTLGPHGANTLIRDEAGTHLATKDGYTVLGRLTFVQETATMVLDHVRAVSRAMVRNVGDGSTSAVVMADALYAALREGALDRFPPGAVQAAIAAAAEEVAAAVRAAARPVGTGDVELVATVSANNDPEVGALVAGAYAEHGLDTNVFVTTGGERTEVRAEPGYRVLRGMVHDCFANEVGLDGATATTCRLQDAAVMVVGEIVTQQLFNAAVAPAMNACIQQGRAFVLVGRDYETDVVRIVADFVRKSPGVKLLMLDHAVATRRGGARLGDLAAVLGASVLGGQNGQLPADPAALLAACGRAEGVRATGSETVFVLAERGPGAAARAAELDAQIARVDEGNHAEEMADELAELRARRRALLGSEVTIAAGGATALERQALMHLLDDAALAVKSALRGGVVEGLGMTGLRALYRGDLDARVLARVSQRTRLGDAAARALCSAVLEGFCAAYRAAALRVLANSRVEGAGGVLNRCVEQAECFNVVTREFAPLAGATVINPADTDVEVVRGAASIVSLFVASNQTVLTRPLAGGGQD